MSANARMVAPVYLTFDAPPTGVPGCGRCTAPCVGPHVGVNSQTLGHRTSKVSSRLRLVTADHVGQLAALATALCWAVSAVCFTAAGRRIGSLVVNLLRLAIGFALLSCANWIVRGHAFPLDASWHAWWWLSWSGVVGFLFGDLCLFRAYVLLGPRLPSLVMSLAPPMTAVIGYFALGEVLGMRDGLGMLLTVGGIAWAVFDRHRGATQERPSVAGLLLALGGAAGQAGGLVLSKLGMGSYSALASTQIRVLAGLLGFAVLFSLGHRWATLRLARHDRTALRQTTWGALFGPFLGVTLSLIAVQATDAGIAASLMAVTPIIVIPIAALHDRERVGVGGWLGALTAVAGVIVLFT